MSTVHQDKAAYPNQQISFPAHTFFLTLTASDEQVLRGQALCRSVMLIHRLQSSNIEQALVHVMAMIWLLILFPGLPSIFVWFGLWGVWKPQDEGPAFGTYSMG